MAYKNSGTACCDTESGRLIALHGLILVLAMTFACAATAEMWRGLTIAPEFRCSPYDRKRDYGYPQSIEQEIVKSLGAIYGPYTGTCFSSTYETDIEHMVSASEAHDSGLCAADRATRARFATDLRNLTLASPTVNRRNKSGKDAAEWLPERNRCWFAARIVEVRRAYSLTIDQREARALERVLSRCGSTDMEPMVCHRTTGSHQRPSTTPAQDENDDVLVRYDDNRNGRITCKEARRHGIAPVHHEHPAYRYMRDGDGDGVVCE
ncbi:MAG: excalibur calcium-binding domain-containing protein [Rhodobacteraceae bacterium]|nr:excalibur calcium-binding domain-containing protein [Paracoccaceae bacterium]